MFVSMPSYREAISNMVPRSARPPSDTISGYQYYLICSILSILVGVAIFWKSRRVAERANETAGVAHQERQVNPDRSRPCLFDAYTGASEKAGNGWEWEGMMPLSVSQLDAYALLADEDEVCGPQTRAQVSVLLRMPGGSNADIPYLELGITEVDLIDPFRPSSSLCDKQPVHLSGAFAA